MEFEISGDFIKLDSLLKACNVVSSGGEAKILIREGEFFVNGEKETRRGSSHLIPGHKNFRTD